MWEGQTTAASSASPLASRQAARGYFAGIAGDGTTVPEPAPDSTESVESDAFGAEALATARGSRVHALARRTAAARERVELANVDFDMISWMVGQARTGGAPARPPADQRVGAPNECLR